MSDLCRETGLAKGSLYKAFRDKRSLYLSALAQYLENGRATLAERLAAAPSARAGLQSWLLSIGEMATRTGPRRGCFGVNATVELAPREPEVRTLVERHTQATQRLYAAAIQRGIDTGELRSDLDPEQIARYLSVFIHGLQALGRGRIEPDEVESLAQHALRALD